MAYYKGIAAFIVLCTILATVFGEVSQGGPHVSQGGPHVSQGGPHEIQGRVRRQAAQTGPEDDIPDLRHANWTTCDITTTPFISCHDCTTKMICKPIGGLLKSCNNPLKPYCNNGICSVVPSAECA